MALIVIIAVAVSPVARKAIVWLLGIAVLAGFGLYVYSEYEDRNRKREEQAAKQRIPLSNVEWIDFRVGRVGMTQLVRLTARVKNKDSRFTLTGLELQLQIQDCPEPRLYACDIVGETLKRISIEIPPGQVMGINTTTYFRDLGPERPGRQWKISPVSVSGR